CPRQRSERSSTGGRYRDHQRLSYHGFVGNVICDSHGRSNQDSGRDFLRRTEGLSHHLMELAQIEGGTPCHSRANRLSITRPFVWFCVFEICVLKFGGGATRRARLLLIGDL